MVSIEDQVGAFEQELREKFELSEDSISYFKNLRRTRLELAEEDMG